MPLGGAKSVIHGTRVGKEEVWKPLEFHSGNHRAASTPRKGPTFTLSPPLCMCVITAWHTQVIAAVHIGSSMQELRGREKEWKEFLAGGCESR
jgi:hypothetical protein